MFTLGTPWQSSELNPPPKGQDSICGQGSQSKEQQKYIFLYWFLKIFISFFLWLRADILKNEILITPKSYLYYCIIDIYFKKLFIYLVVACGI